MSRAGKSLISRSGLFSKRRPLQRDSAPQVFNGSCGPRLSLPVLSRSAVRRAPSRERPSKSPRTSFRPENARKQLVSKGGLADVQNRSSEIADNGQLRCTSASGTVLLQMQASRKDMNRIITVSTCSRPCNPPPTDLITHENSRFETASLNGSFSI